MSWYRKIIILHITNLHICTASIALPSYNYVIGTFSFNNKKYVFVILITLFLHVSWAHKIDPRTMQWHDTRGRCIALWCGASVMYSDPKLQQHIFDRGIESDGVWLAHSDSSAATNKDTLHTPSLGSHHRVSSSWSSSKGSSKDFDRSST